MFIKVLERRTRNRKRDLTRMPHGALFYAAFRNITAPYGVSTLHRRKSWQCRSGLTFYERRIDRVEKSIDVHVFAEVRVGDRFAGLRFGLTGIDSVAEAVGVCIGSEHIHRDEC